MAGGYVCFVVSIAGIGVLTAVIGDVASHFGCTVGFPDAVTAVTFVALGTSVPGGLIIEFIGSHPPPSIDAARPPIWHRFWSPHYSWALRVHPMAAPGRAGWSSQFKPIQANPNPIQTQFKPIHTLIQSNSQPIQANSQPIQGNSHPIHEICTPNSPPLPLKYADYFNDECVLLCRTASLSEDVPSSPLHFVRFFWLLTDYCHGWVAFWVSISWIGFMTAIIGDVASHLGCTVGLLDSVTALSLVAMGTSLPDTFASKVAALNDKYADASIGNVTGSNAVNVFLGIGIAWTLAALYHWWHGRKFLVDPGNLAFNVTIFCVGALVSIIVMMLRRMRCVGGELGGPKIIKYMTTGLLLGLWFAYITLACLEAYDVIEGF
ncbi:Sodium/calcium exchanger 2 [Frankliniella fusca]|uniref:Sodium/calcium exchanger 2 n=1 Tax=Frankliniella fusca TaxID=407009 RepID=A0AAE1LMV3_9NEOP|nr:Sodium/calcium exchanger 2 [Frankliniella fusca]